MIPVLPMLRGGRRRESSTSGQAAVEAAVMLPVVMLLMFGGFQIGRMLYLYNTLQKSLRGGMEYALRAPVVNYCDAADLTLTDARNMIVYGNLQGSGVPAVTGLTVDMIQFFPERADPATALIADCPCTGDGHCDISTGGRSPDYVVVNMPDGFPVDVRFPLVSIGSITVRPAVRMPYLGY